MGPFVGLYLIAIFGGLYLIAIFVGLYLIAIFGGLTNEYIRTKLSLTL